MPSTLSTGALLRDVARLHTHLQRLCVSFCEGTTVTQCTVLTETAQDSFSRFGFRPVERSTVAPALLASVEWTSVCPVSAQAMVLQTELE